MINIGDVIYVQSISCGRAHYRACSHSFKKNNDNNLKNIVFMYIILILNITHAHTGNELLIN